MDVAIGEGVEAFRAEVREFLQSAFPPALRARRYEWPFDAGFHKLLARHGYLNASWPVDQGGGGRDPIEMLAFYEEANRVGVPLTMLVTVALVARVLLVVGTEDQKRVIVRGMLDGDITVALGYTEPDSGSDVAAARTTAVRDGDEWLINGQKMFTSFADVTSHVLLLTRSNTQVPKHEGLTLFLVPLATPGIEVQPLRTLADHHTTMTFYDDVRVGDDARVGAVDGGWSVMKVALAFEHGFALQNMIDNVYEAATAWSQEPSVHGVRPIDDPSTRERLARVAIDREVSDLFRYSIAAILASGKVPGPEASCGKLFQTEAYVRASESLLEIAGPQGLLMTGHPEAPAGGELDYAFRDAPVYTIAGGCSEVMRDVIAQRLLGLPLQRGNASPKAPATSMETTDE